jgi:hypothetical protein
MIARHGCRVIKPMENRGIENENFKNLRWMCTNKNRTLELTELQN